ncbi:hypothetical protein MOP88_01305 [Sphingomonas sp. WKB10]|nr:hypothetical protein [Sphingomonas sp. WKB10]
MVKAVNDWQAGSVGKRRKATAISKAITASPLDSSLTACDVQCYRRSVLTKSAVTQMFFEFEVSEETSSWTTRRAVAAQFRGGPLTLQIRE